MSGASFKAIVRNMRMSAQITDFLRWEQMTKATQTSGDRECYLQLVAGRIVVKDRHDNEVGFLVPANAREHAQYALLQQELAVVGYYSVSNINRGTKNPELNSVSIRPLQPPPAPTQQLSLFDT